MAPAATLLLLLLLLCPALALGCVCPGEPSACTDEDKACLQTLCDPGCRQWLGSIICLDGCRQCLQKTPLGCGKAFQDCTFRCEKMDNHCQSDCVFRKKEKCEVGCYEKNDECVSRCLKGL